MLTFDPDFDERLAKKIEVAGRNIFVDVLEKVLIDVCRLKSSTAFQSFLAVSKFDLRMLEALYAKNPKPLVFKRLARIAKEAKRYDLVAGLEKIIETHIYYRLAKKERVSLELAAVKPAIRPAWVLR